ncbi:hypothetical protein [Kitasatospora sp. NPDC056531]|uniref:hypothetical protein n=1 Tax=Kitasatospora sp. NPDC056531 TaxID=3345856 RepID=UPI003677C23D
MSVKAEQAHLVLRDFEHDPVAMDARWCGDITYVPTEEGWLFLANRHRHRLPAVSSAG